MDTFSTIKKSLKSDRQKTLRAKSSHVPVQLVIVGYEKPNMPKVV